jgi:AcrR family transcriptional regulator
MARGKRRPAVAAVEPAAVPPSRPGPPGGRRDQNRREKVKRLADAALALFLERGIEGTRIDDITEAAGVAKGSFYRYFADKTQLVETIYRPITAAAGEALVRCEQAIEAARGRDALIEAYTRVGLEMGALLLTHAGAIRLYLQERRAPAVGARAPLVELARLLERRAETLSARARERGLLRDYPPVRVSSLAVIGAAEALIHAYLTGVELGNPAEIPRMVTTLIMEGMRPR